jgi:hypothetical protein
VNGAGEFRFEPGLVSELDDPVRRYFTHALAPGAKLGDGVRLTMEGRIKAGAWRPFEAEWQGDGRSFEWRARAGRPFHPLWVVDHCAKGDRGMDVRLFGRIRLVHARGDDATRSVAGRAAGRIDPKAGCAARIRAGLDHGTGVWPTGVSSPA